MKFFVKTLGCKVNQYEGAAIAQALFQNGFYGAKDVDEADILIINSCTVTENSDKKITKLLHDARARNPEIVTVVAGCFPQAFPKEASVCGADIIAGISERKNLAAILKEYLYKKEKKTQVTATETLYENYSYGFSAGIYADKTRATIKIEDGCNRSCAYCIIPKARGKVRSRALDDIVKESQSAVCAGHKELVLAGINLSCYGYDFHYDVTLCDAVEAAAGIDGVERIRLSSLEPDMMTEQVIERLAKIKKLCPHFHLSLQSGCEGTLRRMNRLYTAGEYEKTIGLIRDYFENPAVTTDIIVGFAGETDDEFEESLDFVRKMKFAKIHVFTYSIRKGTIAAEWCNHTERSVKAERYRIMSDTSETMRRDFLTSQIGRTADVLIEKRTSKDFLYGHSANYTPVRIYGSNARRHDIIYAEITDTCGGNCIASVLQKAGGNN